ncbi:MAG: AAA domain-containing protein [Verrucomicrobiota bacterium]
MDPSVEDLINRARMDQGLEVVDVVRIICPLLEQVHEIHENGMVADLHGLHGLELSEEGYLQIQEAATSKPQRPSAILEGLRRLSQEKAGVEILSEKQQTRDLGEHTLVHSDEEVAEDKKYFSGPQDMADYQSWEHSKDLHDELTDIFMLGLVMMSVATGINLTLEEDYKLYCEYRNDLFHLNRKINPVLASLIAGMTALDRGERMSDLPVIIYRLKNYRDQADETDFDTNQLEGFEATTTQGKRELILKHLRDRLFDISRRNRLIYFRASQQVANLTEASVPLTMDPKSIKKEQLFIWHKELESQLVDQKAINLGKYLKFEEARYLGDQMSKIISAARKDKAEYGFEQLRLVICFLRWNNLKESPDEKIVSPLLLLPVTLKKKRGIRDTYTLKSLSSEAEINPALKYHLERLYDLRLPDTLDLSKTSVDEFHASLEKSIQKSEPGVSLEKIDRPQVDLIHQKARIRLDKYTKRLKIQESARRTYAKLPYSYDAMEYDPMGLKLFRQKIEVAKSDLSTAVGAKPQERKLEYIVENKSEALTPKDRVLESEQVFYSMNKSKDQNPYSWALDLCNISLGNFNYRRMTLVHDYEQLLSQPYQSESFDRVFGLTETDEDEAVDELSLEDTYAVMPCDPTQISAVSRARRGDSFIIQGPPGTGKSQTITNLISDFIAHGKRVLFVCEKRAAIDVVYHRLSQVGLGRLCCLIHDSQSDKREFIQDLNDTYSLFRDELSDIELSNRTLKNITKDIQRSVVSIQRYHETMSRPLGDDMPTARELLLRLVELRTALQRLEPEDDHTLSSYKDWVESGEKIRDLSALLSDLGEDPSWGNHALRYVQMQHYECDDAVERVRSGVERLEDSYQQLRETLNQVEVIDSSVRIEELGGMIDFLEKADDLMSRRLMDLLDENSAVSQQLLAQVDLDRKQLLKVAAARENANGWTTLLDREDSRILSERAYQYEKSLLRWVSPGYWSLRGVVSKSYDQTSHAVKRTTLQAIEELKAYYDQETAREEILEAFYDQYGERDVEKYLLLIEDLRKRIACANDELKSLHQHILEINQKGQGAQLMADLQHRFAAFISEAESLLEHFDALDLDDFEELIAEIRSQVGLIPDLLSTLLEMKEVPQKLWEANVTRPLLPDELEAGTARKEVHQFYRNNRHVSHFDIIKMIRGIKRTQRLLNSYYEYNSRAILSRIHESFRKKLSITTTPASQLSVEQKVFKKQYSSGRKELEHEFNKSMRHKSIRHLAGSESGMVISDLKPVWLMSPLSVSDTLPMAEDLFDVVIFDEASQITLEEAVPTLYRGKQVIVVGDRMQLPPTKFFSSSAVLDDEEESERFGIDLNSDSFLTKSSDHLPGTMLSWHYRSRHESLIGFSNAAFYQGELLTIPDRAIPQNVNKDIRCNLNNADLDWEAVGSRAVDELMSRSISFHSLEASPYENRRNRGEAEYIAQMVRALLFQGGGMTLGVVAFSEAQQDEIERALEGLASQDPEFRKKLDEEYEREEDNQFCGLIVKNLENIQGDERDIIILSICYAPNRIGKMIMNFGPINQQGGEKRLNVIFSRAKHRCAVVSSIHSGQITNEYNDGANALKKYLQYAEAVSRGEEDYAQSILATLSPKAKSTMGKPPVKDAVLDQLEAKLREKGWKTKRNVGQSKFRCDIGVTVEGEKHYRLAIMVDTANHYLCEKVMEPYIIRTQVMKAFGWTCAVVLTKDWFHDPESVIRYLERLLEDPESFEEDESESLQVEEVQQLHASPVPEDILDEEDSLQKGPPALPEKVTTPSINDDQEERGISESTRSPEDSEQTIITSYLEYSDEKSNKFWKCEQSGCTLFITYGRIGTKGTNLKKEMVNVGEAERERTRLVRTKVKKGYIEN